VIEPRSTPTIKLVGIILLVAITGAALLAIIGKYNLQSHKGAAPPPTSAEVDTVLRGVAGRANPGRDRAPNEWARLQVLETYVKVLDRFETLQPGEVHRRMKIFRQMLTFAEGITIDHNALSPNDPWADVSDVSARAEALSEAAYQAGRNEP
jgi:hypothetical protein